MLKSLRITVYFICGFAFLCLETALANDFFDNVSASPKGKTHYGMGYETRMERAKLINERSDIKPSHITATERPAKVEKIEQVEKVERPSRPERPMRTSRPNRPERPSRHGR